MKWIALLFIPSIAIWVPFIWLVSSVSDTIDYAVITNDFSLLTTSTTALTGGILTYVIGMLLIVFLINAALVITYPTH